MKNLIFFCFGISLLLIAACSPGSNKNDQEIIDIANLKQGAKTVIDQFATSWETKDIALLSTIMAHDEDMVNFGTDAAEHFVGWETMKSTFEQMMPMLDSVKINIRDQHIKVHHSGEVAWFSQVWDWSFSMQGQPVKIDGQRFTGVLEKRDGKWLIVQFHNSVPVMPQ